MKESKRRAFIKQQATAKKKQEGSLPPKAGGQANPSTKRKSSVKTDCPPKKPKVTPESAVGLRAETKKTATLPAQGKGKGLMTGHVPITEKPPILLREDSEYAFEHLSSIITTDDYKDLSNHAIEAMGKTCFFSIVQVIVSISLLFLSNCLVIF